MAIITDNTLNEVKEIVYDFFAEECEVDISEINDNTNIIKDLDGDSLMFLELIEIFKKKYQLNIELKTSGFNFVRILKSNYYSKTTKKHKILFNILIFNKNILELIKVGLKF